MQNGGDDELFDSLQMVFLSRGTPSISNRGQDPEHKVFCCFPAQFTIVNLEKIVRSFQNTRSFYLPWRNLCEIVNDVIPWTHLVSE